MRGRESVRRRDGAAAATGTPRCCCAAPAAPQLMQNTPSLGGSGEGVHGSLGGGAAAGWGVAADRRAGICEEKVGPARTRVY